MLDELSNKIARACVEAGVNPAISDAVAPDADCVLFDRLPDDCPIPEMQVYRVCRWNATEHQPECWAITVMLEQQIGSMRYWIPVEFIGPNTHRDWRDKDSPQGWKMSCWEESASYADLRALAKDGWWPTLQEAWDAIPQTYRYYDKVWRRESDCATCHCTGVYLWNLIRLPCPECQTTPTTLTYGYQHLMWVPAHTPERLPHAKKGKCWRWRFGTGYVVERVLGKHENVQDWGEYIFVGLKRHEAVSNPNWKYGDDIKVGPEWADFDFGETSVAVATRQPVKRVGWFTAFQRRIASWFHYEEGYYVGPD